MKSWRNTYRSHRYRIKHHGGNRYGSCTRTNFQRIFENATKKKHIHEAVLLVENADGDVSYSFEYGGKDVDTPFLMASITKLLTTSCIFMLMEKGKLSLDDKVSNFLEKDMIQNRSSPYLCVNSPG